MFIQLFAFIFCVSILTTNFLNAGMQYDAQDIGISQTGVSKAISVNDQGQIREGCHKENTLYLHVVNEKYSNYNPDLRESVDRFLKEVWEEAISKEVGDIHEINKIAYEKLNKKFGAAKTLYENGLKFANDTYAPTSIHDETLSSIARLRGDTVCDWNGQGHPLIIVFSNYALQMGDLINVHFGYGPSQENILNFEVASKGPNGKSPRDIFYEWTYSFAEDKIAGTVKEEYSQGRGWRLAVIVNDTIVTVPSLSSPLRDGGCISGHFTQREIQKLAADLDKSLSDEFSCVDREPAESVQQEPEIIIIKDAEELFGGLQLEQEKIFSNGIERIEQGLKDCTDPELRVFYEEMITLMNAMKNSSWEESEEQMIVLKLWELYRKYHGKFDFNFQKNLIMDANIFGCTLDMYAEEDPAYCKEVIQWAEDLVNTFPREPSSYAVLASIKAMNGLKKDEVLPILEKGLALDPNNQECLKLMKNYR